MPGQTTILLVDADPTFVDLTQRILERSGYRVFTILRGETAIEMVCGMPHEIDLILISANLGLGIDGIEAARQILSAYDLPILLISSFAENEVVEKFEQVSWYGFVPKNSGDLFLLLSIKNALKLHQAHLQARESVGFSGRKLTEARLVETSERYHLLFENMHEGFALHEVIQDHTGKVVDFRFLDANQAYEEHTGQKRAEIIGRTILELMPQVDRFQIQRYGHVALTGEPITFEYYSKAFQRALRVKAFSPQKGQFATIFEDVTKARELEAALRDNEEKYRALFNNPMHGVVIFDQQTLAILDANDAFLLIYGYERADIAAGLTSLDISAEAANSIASIKESIRAGTMFIPLRRHRKKDGSVFPVEISGVTHVWRGRPVIFGIIRDISERVKIQAELHENEKRLSLAMDIAGLAGWEYDFDADEYIFNDRWYALFRTDALREGGYRITPEQFLLRFVHPEDQQKVLAEINQSKKELARNYNSAEHRIIRGDGSVRWVAVRWLGSRDFLANRGFGVHQDITEQKVAENQLRQSEKQYRALFEQTHDGVFLLDLQGRHISANKRGEEMLGYTAEELRALSVKDTSAEVEQSNGVIARLLAGEQILPYERLFCTKDGQIFTAEINVEVVRDADGKPLHIQSMLRDISQRKQAEAAIQKLLAEKELLMREVHHRVKNNMSTISGLLSIQASMLSDPAAIEALKDADSRVRSMMTIYDRLYRSGNYHNLPAQAYLSALLDDLAKTWKTPNLPVELVQEIEDIPLPTRMTTALGIFLNECITNAYKYAFPVGRPGTIRVSLRQVGERIEVVVADDGVGLSAEIDVHGSTNFGLNLLGMMARQLDADFHVQRENGTRFSLSIPI